MRLIKAVQQENQPISLYPHHDSTSLLSSEKSSLLAVTSSRRSLCTEPEVSLVAIFIHLLTPNQGNNLALEQIPAITS